MYRINETIENTIVINKSEFITHLYKVETIDEVNEILALNNKKYYDATHNCYAYILGDNQDIQKASDDGEPQKTAGFPMLEVLKRANLTNILAITTRYFGGILLGAGGLIRAYAGSVSEALKKVTLYEVKSLYKYSLNISYQAFNSITKLIPYINIVESYFTDDVVILFLIPEDKKDNLVEDLYKNKINPESLIDLGLENTLIKVNN
ncbi:MAG: YigZ family protein [Acholeplasmatales bacterium]|nr:YigZ family protein [Acholeplasmatales bacterium]